MALSQEEFRQIRRDHDDARRRLRILESLVERRLGFRPYQSQNGNDGDNGNGGNGNGNHRGGGNNRNGNPNENGRGTEGVVGLTRWFEKMEIVFHISNCPEVYQVKMVSEKEDRIERYVGGLPDNIQGNVMSAKPTRLKDAIRLANSNRAQQPQFKRQNVGGSNVARAYTAGGNEGVSLRESYTHDQADILRRIVKQAKAKQPLDNVLDFACKHAKRIQELLIYVRDTCPNAYKPSEKLVAVTPMNKVNKVRFSEPLTSSSNIHKHVESSKTPDSNTPVLPSTGWKSSTSACRSQPTSYKKNDRISQTPTKKSQQHNIWKPTGKVFTEVGYKWKPTGRLFTLVGNSCPLTRITSTKVVPIKETTSHSVETQKPEIKVYSRRPKQVKSVDVPSSSSLVNERNCSIRKRPNYKDNEGYGDYQLGNVIFSRVYYVEGLGHNLFSVGQFCDADLEVSFRKNTFFIQNLEDVDLLLGSRDTNLYTISLDDMIKTSPIYLLSKASKTKSWLWHCQLSHLNFGTLNKLAKDGLARGILKLKFKKDYLCSACALGVSTEDANQKFLRSLPSSWSQVSLIMRTKPGVDSLSFDDLYNNLRVFETDVKGSTGSSSSAQNVAFVSSESTSSTNDVSTAYVVQNWIMRIWNQFDEFNLEEMDLKWQVAMISMRLKKFYKKTGRKLQFDAKEPVGFNKTKEEPKALVTLDGDGVDWTGHVEDEQENFALMGYNHSGSDIEREKLGDASIEIKAYTLALAKMSAKDKSGLRSSDVEDSPVYDRFARVEGMHAVPPPMTGNYMPPKSDFGIDKLQFTYGPKQSKTSESDAKTSDFNSYESNSSVETLESVPELVVIEPKVVSQPKVWSDAPIIEEYESDNDDEYVVKDLKHQNKFVPTAVLIRTGEFPVNTARYNFNSQAVSTSAARKANVVQPIMNDVRPRPIFNKTRSPIRRPFNRTTAPKTDFSNQKVNTARDKAVSVVGGIRETAVKTSAGCNWRSKRHYWNKFSKYNGGSNSRKCDDPQQTLKGKDIVDSGCSRHMTGNKAYLVEYQDYNGGPVAFVV
ncbi:ribonuclease H-like domain-containing protein [Tanacetum coccineum]